MKNLKLLYFLTLCALCLYVAIGPAQAGVVIRNLGIGVETSVQGDLSWVSRPAWADIGYGPTARLGFEALCGPTAPCGATVDFSFIVEGGGQGLVPITISLSGSSTDHNATGTVAFYDGAQQIQHWTSPDGFLLMAPFTVNTPSSIERTYNGEFTFSLAPGGDLIVPLGASLNFNSAGLPASDAPEPGSALLLGVGIACVGFLRRKVHG